MFYNAQKYLLNALKFRNMQVTDNLFIHAHKREFPANNHLYDEVGAIRMYDPYDSSSGMNVQGNIVQGTEGYGVAFPCTPCSQKGSAAFINNQVGVADEAAIMYNPNTGVDSCQWIGKNSGYHSKRGVMVNPSGVRGGL